MFQQTGQHELIKRSMHWFKAGSLPPKGSPSYVCFCRHPPRSGVRSGNASQQKQCIKSQNNDTTLYICKTTKRIHRYTVPLACSSRQLNGNLRWFKAEVCNLYFHKKKGGGSIHKNKAARSQNCIASSPL